MPHLVVDERIVVNNLCLVGNDTAVEHTFGTLAAEGKVGAVACHSIVEGYDIVVYAAVSFLIDI